MASHGRTDGRTALLTLSLLELLIAAKNSIGGNSQNNKNNRYQKQERNGKREMDGPLVTECGLCSIIRNKEVPQEYLGIPFKERHREVSSRPIYPNDCLAWINLSLDDREKVLHNNDLHCKTRLQGQYVQ